jgi:uncharacterized protein
MKNKNFSFKSNFNCDKKTLFTWHLAPNAFQRLCPPWENVRVISKGAGMEAGVQAVLEITEGPIKFGWNLIHKDFIANEKFSDLQTHGPFQYWFHEHLFGEDKTGSYLEDRISYRLPFHSISSFFLDSLIREKLFRLFEFRHEVLKNDMQIKKYNKKGEKMRILISGSSGLVGTDLKNFLITEGHDVYSLVRRSTKPKEIFWDPENSKLNLGEIEGFDAVIHLAGENIANKRWTKKQKEKISETRIQGTKLLSESLAQLNKAPKVFICASAIGFYGERSEESLDEESRPGKGFLAETCIAWEAACQAAVKKGIRTINLRIGVILSSKGGALAKILPVFELGLGGSLASGKQYMSWIALDDVIGAIYFLLHREDISGPVNLCSPNPIRNSELSKTLAKVLFRPAILPVPGFLMKLLLGQMAEELLLVSSKIYPKKLKEAAYQFLYPDLEPALRYLLGRK